MTAASHESHRGRQLDWAGTVSLQISDAKWDWGKGQKRWEVDLLILVVPSFYLKHDRKFFYFSTTLQSIYKHCYALTLLRADENPHVLINFPDDSHASSQHGPWQWSLWNEGIIKNTGSEVKETYIRTTVRLLSVCALRTVTNLLEFVPLRGR